MTDAHDQKVTHHYVMRYPEHEPREGDVHYADFREYRRRTAATAKCQFGVDRGGDFSECIPGPEGWPHGLELHHGAIEYALLNSVDLELLERDYPGVSTVGVGAWIESAPNLIWLCSFHHRGHGGVHNASASDWVAEHYIRGLIT